MTVDMQRTSHLVPKDLKELVERSIFSDFSVYYKSYAYFLLFLCNYNLHNSSECKRSLLELESYRDFQLFLTDGTLQQNTRKLIDIANIKIKNFN